MKIMSALIIVFLIILGLPWDELIKAHWGLVTPYGDINLGQVMLGGAIKQQAIT